MPLPKNLLFFIRPVAHLPCPGKATLAVRCCPVYFELKSVLSKGIVNTLERILYYIYIQV